MRDLAAEGGSAPAGKRAVIHPSRLPEIAPVEVTGTDPDGDPIARPVGWQGEGRPPVIYMRPEPKGHPALTAARPRLASTRAARGLPFSLFGRLRRAGLSCRWRKPGCR